MDLVRNVSVDLTIMKEPRGFLRAIQFVLAIFAFATVCTSATVTINVACTKNSTSGISSSPVDIKYSYPFNLKSITLKQPFCSPETTDDTPFGDESFAAAPQFFCFVGVMSFLLCIAYFIGYVLFSPLFINNSTAATVDFIFSLVWTVIWFIASTAWADRLTVMGTYLAPSYIIKNNLDSVVYCGMPSRVHCTAGEAGNHATLIVSVLFGYVNMLIWGAGLWFLYKETRWHKEQDGDMTNIGEPTPNAGSAADAPYQAPDNSATPTY